VESANRAYVQLTLNRLKEIATGQAPALDQVEGTTEGKTPSRKASTKKSSGGKTASAKTTRKAPVKKQSASPKKAVKAKVSAGKKKEN
jgi:hypothetical protein